MPLFTDTLCTAAEFKELAPEFDLTGIDDNALTTMLSRASRSAETWTNRKFAQDQFTEDHEWRPSRRCYLRQWPVASIDAAQFILGATVTATILPTSFYINNTSRYIELSQLALAMTLTPDLLTLGLIEPSIRVTYTGAFAILPDEVKIGVAIIAAARIAQRRMIEQGIAGVMSMTIGSYTVTVSRPRGSGRSDTELAGFAGFMPPEAQELLSNFRMTSVR